MKSAVNSGSKNRTPMQRAAEAGLYDYRNRHYSPQLGRFLQTDPIRFDAGDVNLYRYVGNSVTVLRDPDGRHPILVAAAVAAGAYALYKLGSALIDLADAADTAYEEGQRRREALENDADPSDAGLDSDAFSDMANDIGSACKNMPGTSLQGVPPSVPRMSTPRLPAPMSPVVDGGRGMPGNGFP